jgi:hypothetical protein
LKRNAKNAYVLDDIAAGLDCNDFLDEKEIGLAPRPARLDFILNFLAFSAQGLDI